MAAGEHTLLTRVWLPPAAYDPAMDRIQTSDGVEIALVELGPGEARRILYTRLLDPRDHPADRGYQPIRIKFVLEREGDIQLFFGPGPNGRDTRDWIKMDRLLIE